MLKMFLGTPFQTNNITENYEMYIDICELARLEVAKFLGITIDGWKNKLIM